MSSWTYINGTIRVSPMGRTQEEKRFILETVLNHLPLVTGSEKDMDIYIIQKNGHNQSSSHDEFGKSTNNLIDYYGDKSSNGVLKIQNSYILVVNGSFRDRKFKDTLKEFNKFLCRLAKRVGVEDVMVEIKGYRKSILIRDNNKVYADMFEYPSWSYKTDSSNWCERIMWSEERN